MLHILSGRYMLSPVVLKRSVHQHPCATLRHVDWLVVDMATYCTVLFLRCTRNLMLLVLMKEITMFFCCKWLGKRIYYLSILFGSLRDWARCIKSCAVIGYPSGQDGAILPSRDYPLESLKKIMFFFHLKDPLLTKLVLRWPDIGLVFFFRFYGPYLCLGPKETMNVANIHSTGPNMPG